MNLSTVFTALNVFKGVQVTQSMTAGAIAAGVVGAVGAVLVAQNIVLPFVGLPLTGAEVAGLAWLVNQGVTAFVPDKTQEQIVGLAMKAEGILKTVPTLTPDYTIAKDQAFASHPKAAAAIAVINMHVAATTPPSSFPSGTNGT